MIDPASRVLVVDDIELVRTMLRRALGDLGIVIVDEAKDGLEAESMLIQAAQNQAPYHAIFADWNMPGKTGLELLTSLRAHPAYRTTPFVMVTAESERDFVIKALAAGATDYIVKPVSGDGLRRKIESINRRLQRAAS